MSLAWGRRAASRHWRDDEWLFVITNKNDWVAKSRFPVMASNNVDNVDDADDDEDEDFWFAQ
jgi:hypothetical protein